MKQNSRSERANLADMSPDFDLHERRLEGLSTLIFPPCCAGNEIAAEERLKFHFWARLIFLLVFSFRILSTGVKTEEECAAMCKIFLEPIQ